MKLFEELLNIKLSGFTEFLKNENYIYIYMNEDNEGSIEPNYHTVSGDIYLTDLIDEYIKYKDSKK